VRIETSQIFHGPVEATVAGERREYVLGQPRFLSPDGQVPREFTVWIGRDGWSAEVELLGREEALTRRLARLDRAEGEADPRVVTPMPGTVVAVMVQDGERVEAGRHLLSVEAMKMEHQLTAPLGGIVHLNVAPGDQVKAKAAVATIHPEDPGHEN
jgi:acetyl-CoA/propionyl-CoA carboxylase, biotin carboxylase, biotin carboxyl carrier protein